MAESVTKTATYADLEAVPPHLVAELLFGVIETHPRPASPHAMSSLSLGHELVGPFQKGRGGPGGWLFMDEPELDLPPHVCVPDLAGWRRERMPRPPLTGRIKTSPDWVCELLSPSTARVDRILKARIYAQASVGNYWLLDPVDRTLEVLSLRDGQWLQVATFSDDEPVAAPPFEAVTFRLADLWPVEFDSEET